MTQPELRPDRWHSRDFPVLLATAQQLDAGERLVRVSGLQEATGFEPDQIMLALDGLVPSYLDGKPLDSLAGRVDFMIKGMTERGRRATGLWPREDEASAALVDLLEQAADQTSDEDDAGALRKAGRLLKSVPGNVIADVTAALIRQQAGL